MVFMLVLVILWLEILRLVLRQSGFRAIYGSRALSCFLLRRATTHLGHAKTVCDHTTRRSPHDLRSLVGLALLAVHSFCLFIQLVIDIAHAFLSGRHHLRFV